METLERNLKTFEDEEIYNQVSVKNFSQINLDNLNLRLNERGAR